MDYNKNGLQIQNSHRFLLDLMEIRRPKRVNTKSQRITTLSTGVAIYCGTSSKERRKYTNVKKVSFIRYRSPTCFRHASMWRTSAGFDSDQRHRCILSRDIFYYSNGARKC